MHDSAKNNRKRMSNAVFATRPDTEPAAAELTDPRTGQSRPLAHDPADIPATVATARAAAVGWAALTTAERSRRLLRLAAVIEDNAARYVAAERAGTGKPEAEAVNEIAQCVDIIRFYAGAARADSAPAGGRLLPGRESWVRWEPLGVVAAIVPWNYPLLMATWRFAPALAAGNAVVLKPAETTPDSALLVAAHAAEVLGPGVLSTVPGDRETGRRLMASQVDAVAFTGSRASGLDVQRSAGLRRVPGTGRELPGHRAAGRPEPHLGPAGGRGPHTTPARAAPCPPGC
jgi:betaine-aldehyde dehydrogenase